MKLTRPRCLGAFVVVAVALVAAPVAGQSASSPPAPPTDVVATDHPVDNGTKIDLTWKRSPDDPERVSLYRVYRLLDEAERTRAGSEAQKKAIVAARQTVTASILGPDWADQDFEAIPAAERTRIREQRAAAAESVSATFKPLLDRATEPGRALNENPATRFLAVSLVDVAPIDPGGSSETYTMTMNDLTPGTSYEFFVVAVDAAGVESAPAYPAGATEATTQWFDGSRFYFLMIVLIICGAVVWYISHARRGKTMKIRKIAGLEAVDEAVGRATEMGRPVLFIPGIQDMNEMQTIAGITILSRVAKTAAEYDARVEVPTARSLVMTTAREAVQAAFLAAGRPDAYNEDLIYYVTDEQFGYVAYVTGMMVREKPAACFYMGMFYAESLILAETGNSIGAIQIAGTAQPAQLPFFVAACDYTLIGEEFFAASAYLSGSPEELGSLKGQDVGKVLVAALLLIGVALMTIGNLFDVGALNDWATYLTTRILS